MSVAQTGMRMPSFGLRSPLAAVDGDDPVAVGLRQSARRMVGVAGFSGVVNVLMLSGSLIGAEEAQVAAGAAGKVIATYVERGSLERFCYWRRSALRARTSPAS